MTGGSKWVLNPKTYYLNPTGGSKWVLDLYPRGYVMPEHASLYLNVANPEV